MSENETESQDPGLADDTGEVESEDQSPDPKEGTAEDEAPSKGREAQTLGPDDVGTIEDLDAMEADADTDDARPEPPVLQTLAPQTLSVRAGVGSDELGLVIENDKGIQRTERLNTRTTLEFQMVPGDMVSICVLAGEAVERFEAAQFDAVADKTED